MNTSHSSPAETTESLSWITDYVLNDPLRQLCADYSIDFAVLTRHLLPLGVPIPQCLDDLPEFAHTLAVLTVGPEQMLFWWPFVVIISGLIAYPDHFQEAIDRLTNSIILTLDQRRIFDRALNVYPKEVPWIGPAPVYSNRVLEIKVDNMACLTSYIKKCMP